MTQLPLEPYIRAHPVPGSKRFESEARRNDRAFKIARHANEMILACPDGVQILTFNAIALKSGFTFDEVKDALSRGEGSGLTVVVRPEDRDNIRRALA